MPLWHGTGGSVPLTLGWLAGPAALAALLWVPQLKSGHVVRTHPASSSAAGAPAADDGRPADPAGSQAATRNRVAVHRHALTWQITLFMGIQSLLFFAALSWLPTILRDRGVSAAAAGSLLALMGVGNLAVSLVVPVAAQRMRAQYALVVPTVAAIAVGMAGVVYLPLGSAAVWMLILGAGQNAAPALRPRSRRIVGSQESAA